MSRGVLLYILDSELRTEYGIHSSPEMRVGRDPEVGLPRDGAALPAAAAGRRGHDWADLSLPGRFQNPGRATRRFPGFAVDQVRISDFGHER